MIFLSLLLSLGGFYQKVTWDCCWAVHEATAGPGCQASFVTDSKTDRASWDSHCCQLDVKYNWWPACTRNLVWHRFSFLPKKTVATNWFFFHWDNFEWKSIKLMILCFFCCTDCWFLDFLSLFFFLHNEPVLQNWSETVCFVCFLCILVWWFCHCFDVSGFLHNLAVIITQPSVHVHACFTWEHGLVYPT